jgi:AcrR family transcriptional regulator
MPRIVDHDIQRQSIRRAAQRVFARRGVEAVGLVHVAKAAGIGRASIYHYYPHKAALVRDLVRDLLAEEERLFSQALRNAKGRPLERIQTLAAQLTELFAQWASLGKMFLDLWATSGPTFKPFFRVATLAELIAEGQRAGDIDRTVEPLEAAVAVIAIIDGMLLQMIVDPAGFGEAAQTRHLLVRSVQRTLQAMSSLALMRLLESAPARYDAGMRMLTLGRVEQIRDALAEAAAPSAAPESKSQWSSPVLPLTLSVPNTRGGFGARGPQGWPSFRPLTATMLICQRAACVSTLVRSSSHPRLSSRPAICLGESPGRAVPC